MRSVFFFLAVLLCSSIACASTLSAQTHLSGKITHQSEALSYATVKLQSDSLLLGTTSNQDGFYTFEDLQSGWYEMEVRHVGYFRFTQRIFVAADSTYTLDIELEADQLELESAVVTGTRAEVPLYNSPIIVNRIGKRTFESTQAISLAEGLNFSPGLRVENNCQNCGFTQLRMNGLDGPYSQILINSRPVFSALAGVYGLELIPATMVERIEVVKGGGSVMYGGNAIAGTVNIITREPVENRFELGLNQSFTDAAEPDRTLSFNGSMVNKDLSRGISFYGFNRSRDPWDANGDSFSELTQLRNTTVGLDAYLNPNQFSKWKISAYGITEFRRGGNGFELAPHQTDITEQVDHNILGASASYERFSQNFMHKLSVYSSLQTTDRQSYYGAGGRIVLPGAPLLESDLIAVNAYGNSNDIALAQGLQYAYEPNTRFLLTLGSEYQLNDVEDRMPGYQRSIDQRANTLGSYAQLQYQLTEKWNVVAGGRYDVVAIDGEYRLLQSDYNSDQNLAVFVPRISTMYDLLPDLKLRLSYAEGYRAPQAFDEDLHIEVVGGAALFIQLDPDLEAERSRSYTGSLNWSKMQGNVQANLVLEGFLTELNNPFVLADQRELPNGVGVIRKRNGDGARVYGINMEANVAFSRNTVLQMGGTLQRARFNSEEVIWSPEEGDLTPATTTRNILRNPDLYGFMSLVHNPTKFWEVSWSTVFTGPMDVSHVIDPETEFTVIKHTPSFWEHNLKLTYELDRLNGISLFSGVQNLFNAFQNDFDLGPDRDPGYVYGPTRPRTIYGGLKVNFN